MGELNLFTMYIGKVGDSSNLLSLICPQVSTIDIHRPLAKFSGTISAGPKTMHSSLHQHRQDQTVLSCPCRWCKQNYLGLTPSAEKGRRTVRSLILVLLLEIVYVQRDR